jgi:hypothetical protein
MGVMSPSLVAVVWSAGLEWREAERSASLVVVVWSAGLVCREAVWTASLVVVRDVACVAVVCHDDVNWDACFDGERVDLLAEGSVEALRKVGDSSCERV